MSARMMDGPAAGREFAISRYPELLRVVVAGDGAWDALDLLDDTPREGETVHLYARLTLAHVCARGGPAASGWYATYAHQEIDEETRALIRGTDAWRAWAEAHGPRILEGSP